IAIDLDYCRDPETGIIALWAQEIIHNINSYAEVSPSGEGVRIFLFGILPPTGRKKGDYENYQTGRYVTVTGQHLEGTPTTIEHRQAELEQVHRRIWPAPPAATHPTPKGVGHSGVRLDDAEIIRRAAAAKNGTKFTQRGRGDTGGYCPHSEADLALCNYLGKRPVTGRLVGSGRLVAFPLRRLPACPAHFVVTLSPSRSGETC